MKKKLNLGHLDKEKYASLSHIDLPIKKSNNSVRTHQNEDSPFTFINAFESDDQSANRSNENRSETKLKKSEINSIKLWIKAKQKQRD